MASSWVSSATIPTHDEPGSGAHRTWLNWRAGLWVFAVRNLMTRPTRALLALMGLSIPVLGVLGLFSLSGGIRNLLGETLAQVHGILVLRENAPSDIFSDLPAELGEALRRVPGVRVVAPQIWKIAPSIEGRGLFARTAAGFLARPREQPLQGILNLIQIEGQDLAEHARLRSDVYRGKMVASELGGGRFLDQRDQEQPRIVISTKLAAEFPDSQGHPRKVGNPLEIGSRPFTIVGIYDTGSMLLDNTIVMDITMARQLLNLKDETVSCFLVEPADPAQIDAVAGAIERAIPGLDARTMSEFQADVGQVLGKVDTLLLLIIGLALMVGSVGILNTMLMSTTERFAEFGVLRTNGWSRGDVLHLVLAESICLGLLAGVLGCLLALAGVAVVNRFLGHGLQLALTPGLLALGLGLAAALGTLGGLYPAWRASRLAPMETIRLGSR
jgi:putative ABC transport system permease protein